MRSGLLYDDSNLPAVIEPDSDDPLTIETGLTDWAMANQPIFQEQLNEHGALLFRGFDLGTPAAFEAFAGTFTKSFNDYKGGISPRKHIAGNIQTSTEVPRILPIPLHIEMAYLDKVPNRIMFCCQIASRQGGQTPIADMQAVYRAMDPEVLERFESKGLRLIQNDKPKTSKHELRSWRDRYGDKAGVEAFCSEHNIEASWPSEDTLQLVSQRPISTVHPISGERVWLNSAIWHDSFSWEVRHAGHPFLATFLRWLENRSTKGADSKRHQHATYRDGTEIPREDIEHVRQTLWDHAVLFDWQPGDALIIDNLRVAHGRMPFKGQRRILTALGESVPVTSTPRLMAATQS